jgi:hypothetical protein
MANPQPSFPDPWSLQAADLRYLVEQVANLSTAERSALFRYREHVTTRPGKCTLFTYKFQVDADRPIVGLSRPIPFALRPAVREQLNEAKLCRSPQVEIKVAGRIVINAIWASGSDVNLPSERVYEKLTKSGVYIPVLPV